MGILSKMYSSSNIIEHVHFNPRFAHKYIRYEKNRPDLYKRWCSLKKLLAEVSFAVPLAFLPISAHEVRFQVFHILAVSLTLLLRYSLPYRFHKALLRDGQHRNLL